MLSLIFVFIFYFSQKNDDMQGCFRLLLFSVIVTFFNLLQLQA